MALRNKNYRENRIEVSSHREEPPVSTPPAVTAAELPPIAADIKPPEPIEEKSPAEKAGESALRQRLKEMENAEAITRQPPQRPPPQQEPPPQLQDHNSRRSSKRLQVLHHGFKKCAGPIRVCSLIQKGSRKCNTAITWR